MAVEKDSLDIVRDIVVTFATPMFQPALPSLDFCDYRAVFMQEGDGGRAIFAQGEAEGSDRAVKAAEAALADLRRQLAETDAPLEDFDPLAAAASR